MLSVTKSKFICLTFWTVKICILTYRRILYCIITYIRTSNFYFPEAHFVSNFWLLDKGTKLLFTNLIICLDYWLYLIHKGFFFFFSSLNLRRRCISSLGCCVDSPYIILMLSTSLSHWLCLRNFWTRSHHWKI